MATTKPVSDRTKQIIQIVSWVIVLSLFAICAGTISCVVFSGGSNDTERFGIDFDDSREAQEERRNLIQQLRSEGVFHKVEWTGLAPKIWVTPKFMLLDVDTKESFCEVVYTYYAADREDFGDDAFDFVGLKSSLDDSDVGTYGPSLGLEMK